MSDLIGQFEGKIERLEGRLEGMAQVEIPVKESWKDGLYVRELVIPKDTMLTGKVWKSSYLDIMLYGQILVATPDGAREFKGPNVMDGAAGRKRAGYAVEDTGWVTVHRVDDAAQASEDHLTFFSKKEYNRWLDHMDHAALLEEFKITPEEAWAQTTDVSDQIQVGHEHVRFGPSDIHGRGTFAMCPFPPGKAIGVARFQGMRTELGRYVNHSRQPNAEMVEFNGSILLVATKPIDSGAEIVIDYRQALRLQIQEAS